MLWMTLCNTAQDLSRVLATYKDNKWCLSRDFRSGCGFSLTISSWHPLAAFGASNPSVQFPDAQPITKGAWICTWLPDMVLTSLFKGCHLQMHRSSTGRPCNSGEPCHLGIWLSSQARLSLLLWPHLTSTPSPWFLAHQNCMKTLWWQTV